MVNYDRIHELIQKSREKRDIPGTKSKEKSSHSTIYWRRAYSKVSNGDAIVTIESDKVSADKVGIVYQISILNKDNDFTKARVGIYDGSMFHIYGEQESPQADVLYWIHSNFYILEGDRIRAEFYSTAPNDRLDLFINVVLKDLI